MTQPVKVLLADITIADDKVTIGSPALATSLVQFNRDAVKLMRDSAEAAVYAFDIEIDAQGRVVVNNAQFAAALARRAQGIGPAAGNENWICGWDCEPG